jgi:hypothetical protein
LENLIDKTPEHQNFKTLCLVFILDTGSTLR